LRSEVLADEPPEKLNHIEGNEICQNVKEKQYPEFENNNYVLMGESNLEMNDIKLEEIQNENQNSDFKSKMSNLLKKVGLELEKKAKVVSNKFKEMEIGEKFKTTGQKAFIVFKKAGKFVVKKSQPMYEKISEKSKEGASSLSKKSKELYSEIKLKFSEKKTQDMPVSDYYELSARPIASNENIIKYIDDKETLNDQQCTQQLINPNNSFRLLTESIDSNSQVEGNYNFFNEYFNC
jgi:hypothetical protein